MLSIHQPTQFLARFTVRGLHPQIGNAAQAKLIRCKRGSILDVALDIHRGSPNFGRHFAVVLANRNLAKDVIALTFASGCTMYRTALYAEHK